MIKYLRRKISDYLFPYLHDRIIAKHAQEKHLARFMKRSNAVYKGIDRRELADRRIRKAANDHAA